MAPALTVMAALLWRPSAPDFRSRTQPWPIGLGVDGRHKGGHDGECGQP
jgi:hypothetical protein